MAEIKADDYFMGPDGKYWSKSNHNNRMSYADYVKKTDTFDPKNYNRLSNGYYETNTPGFSQTLTGSDYDNLVNAYKSKGVASPNDYYFAGNNQWVSQANKDNKMSTYDYMRSIGNFDPKNFEKNGLGGYQSIQPNGQAAYLSPTDYDNLTKGISDKVKGAPSTVKVGGTGASPAGSSSNGTNSINADLKYDDQGRPIRNPYGSILDSGGNVLDQFSMANKIGPDIKLDTQGMDAIKQRALSSGPSAWANLATQQQQLNQQNQLGQAQKNAASQSNAAMNALRMRGGMSSGQRERLAMQGARSAGGATQGILNQGANQRLQIGLQDQQTKDQMLQSIPGLDLANANFQQGQRAYDNQFKQFDVGNALKDVVGLNAYNADAFGKAMQDWSAGKVADAQARASSGGKK